jgi:phosphomannomutase
MGGIFKAYDIRGRYPDEIDSVTAEKIGSGFVRLLKARQVVTGRDMRPSSRDLADAFIRGAVGEGAMVADIGMASTPLLNFTLIEGGYDGGAMVTASHLPPEMNGFKLSRKNAIPLSGENDLPLLEQIVNNTPVKETPPPSSGFSRNVSMTEPYIEKIGSFVKNPARLKIVVDAGNGMAGPEVTYLMRQVPSWTLVPMYFAPDERFPHHVPNPALPATTRDLQAKVIAEGADLGVAFDGDVDRSGFIDEQGNRVRGDLVTALFSEHFLTGDPGETVLYDLRSSRIVPETIARLHGRGIRTRVGHAFIRPLMRKERAIFGGELSGHYYYRDMGFCDNGLFSMITMANILARENLPLSALIRPYEVYGSTGEINIRVRDFDTVARALEARYRDAETDRLDGLTVCYPDWWFNIRHSHTEPLVRLNLETRDRTRVEEMKNQVLSVIRNADPHTRVLE